MSVRSFQRALCDLIASPSLCLALRADAEVALASYELSAREHKRLAEVVWQRGMSTNCTLYRSNRVTPIYTLLNYTCLSLGDQLGPLLDQFWGVREYQDGQFLSEVERFAHFLNQQIAEGAISSPFASELLGFELAINTLVFGPRAKVLRELARLPAPDADTPCLLHPLARIVRFSHDPTILLSAAARGAMPSSSIPEQSALAVVGVLDGELKVMRLADEARFTPADGLLTPRLAPELADAGLLVLFAIDDRLSQQNSPELDV